MWEALRRLFGKKPPEPELPLKPIEPDPSWEPPTRPAPEPAPWSSDRIPQAVGPGEKADYPGYSCATTRIQWVSRERDGNGQPVSVRVPEPETRVMPMGDFTAADRQYTAPRRLAANWYDKDGLLWCGDIYGRRVLYGAERFPCFDSSDYLYEDRYYRWFFLWDGEKLTRVQYTDERDTVTVTEDVRDIENKWWKVLQGLACFR